MGNLQQRSLESDFSLELRNLQLVQEVEQQDSARNRYTLWRDIPTCQLYQEHVFEQPPTIGQEIDLYKLRTRNPELFPIVAYFRKLDIGSDRFACRPNLQRLQVFVEHLPLKLRETSNLPFEYYLHVLRKVLASVQILTNYIPCFLVASDMIGFNQQDQIKVWFSPNLAQTTLDLCGHSACTQEQTVQSIFSAVVKHACPSADLSLFDSQRKRLGPYALNLKRAEDFISDFCMKYGVVIPKSIHVPGPGTPRKQHSTSVHKYGQVNKIYFPTLNETVKAAPPPRNLGSDTPFNKKIRHIPQSTYNPQLKHLNVAKPSSQKTCILRRAVSSQTLTPPPPKILFASRPQTQTQAQQIPPLKIGGIRSCELLPAQQPAKSCLSHREASIDTKASLSRLRSQQLILPSCAKTGSQTLVSENKAVKDIGSVVPTIKIQYSNHQKKLSTRQASSNPASCGPMLQSQQLQTSSRISSKCMQNPSTYHPDQTNPLNSSRARNNDFKQMPPSMPAGAANSNSLASSVLGENTPKGKGLQFYNLQIAKSIVTGSKEGGSQGFSSYPKDSGNSSQISFVQTKFNFMQPRPVQMVPNSALLGFNNDNKNSVSCQQLPHPNIRVMESSAVMENKGRSSQVSYASRLSSCSSPKLPYPDSPLFQSNRFPGTPRAPFGKNILHELQVKESIIQDQSFKAPEAQQSVVIQRSDFAAYMQRFQQQLVKEAKNSGVSATAVPGSPLTPAHSPFVLGQITSAPLIPMSPGTNGFWKQPTSMTQSIDLQDSWMNSRIRAQEEARKLQQCQSLVKLNKVGRRGYVTSICPDDVLPQMAQS